MIIQTEPITSSILQYGMPTEAPITTLVRVITPSQALAINEDPYRQMTSNTSHQNHLTHMGTPEVYRQHEVAQPQFQVMTPPPINKTSDNHVTACNDILYPQPIEYERTPPVYQNQTSPIYQAPNLDQNPPVQNMPVINPTGIRNSYQTYQGNEPRYQQAYQPPTLSLIVGPYRGQSVTYGGTQLNQNHHPIQQPYFQDQFQEPAYAPAPL